MERWSLKGCMWVVGCWYLSGAFLENPSWNPGPIIRLFTSFIKYRASAVSGTVLDSGYTNKTQFLPSRNLQLNGWFKKVCEPLVILLPFVHSSQGKLLKFSYLKSSKASCVGHPYHCLQGPDDLALPGSSLSPTMAFKFLKLPQAPFCQGLLTCCSFAQNTPASIHHLANSCA